MCGITGIIGTSNSAERALVERMRERLKHRGPDSAGAWNDERVALGMRRLSIIDLAGGGQPLFNEDRSIVLIANGEIYNYIELRAALERQGHHFATHSDCETIVHAYEEYGDECVHHLRGMFAFCLYDTKRKRVLIVRDRLGEKPLYLYEREGRIVFASEMKALLEGIEKKDRVVDHDMLYAYLHFGYVPEPHTLLRGVYKLPAGTLITVSLEPYTVTKSSYWEYSSIPAQQGEPVSLVRRELEEIERIIIRSDVPVGVALSGGIDSSVIAVLSKHNATTPMHAFSVGYTGILHHDEQDLARNLARQLSIPFHPITIDTKEFLRDFDRLVYETDDPIADIAAYGYWRLAQAAREAGVPVLLTGFGGDELFWGYAWVREALRFNLLKRTHAGRLVLLGILVRRYRRAIQHAPLSTMRRIIREAYSSDVLLFDLTSSFRRVAVNRPQIFQRGFLDSVTRTPESFFNRPEEQQLPISLNEKLNETWLYSNSIALGDRTSMAHSVEMRLPLVDASLVELVLGLRKSGQEDWQKGGKHWLISAIRDLLPREVLERPKMGFQPPTSEWMRAIICTKKNLLREGYLVRNNIIHPAFIEQHLKAAGPYEELLYRMTILETWLSLYV